ncbi:MAG: flagellar hook-basal body complex protein FliE [Candidatus Marinimicrobia bacterium]|nr:flagellar hook-basal body complex protein FliE [Candidatus Neomarinimicrobiota bacterium]
MKIPDNPVRIDPTGATGASGSQQPGRKPGDVRFSDQLKELLSSVNAKQAEASEKVSDVVTGESEDLHSAMIALEEASISFQLMLEIRNKMLEAYQEINRMNI